MSIRMMWMCAVCCCYMHVVLTCCCCRRCRLGSLQSGEPITFFWQFAGIGQERCFHDDVEIPDCSSGVIVQVSRRFL